MVETRSGVHFPAKGSIQDGEQIQQQHSLSPENVDSDEDEIPCVISPNRPIDPSIRSLDHRRTRKRQLDGDLSIQLNPPKKRKTEPLGSSRNARLDPTPASSFARQLSGTATAGKASKSPSPEDTVPPGLVSSVNAAFKHKGRGEHQRVPAPANSQLSNVAAGSQEYEIVRGGAKVNTQVQSNHDERIGLQDPLNNDHTSIGASRHGKSSATPIIELQEGHEAEAGPSSNSAARHPSGDAQSQADIWDVPMIPGQKSLPKKSGASGTSAELPRGVRRIEVHIPQRGSRHVQLSQTGQIHSSEQTGPALERDRNVSPELGEPEPEVNAQDIQQEDGVAVGSGHIGGFSSDDEDLSDFDFSENGFAQDVAKFRTRYPGGYKGSEVIPSLREDDDITTSVGFSPLRRALRLMGHEAWSGKGRQWHERPFRFDYMQSGSVRILLKFLTKLERLLEAAPKGPRIREQNKFLKEHGDLLSYYFTKIMAIIRHIRKIKPRTEGLSRSRRNKEITEYDQIHKDVVSLAIPMLFHVLASTWWLGGGKYETRVSFTYSTIELLMKILGWIGLLYRPLLRAQRQQPPEVEGEGDEEDNETKRRRSIRSIKQEKREELEEILNELKQRVEAGLNRLDREEHRRNVERHALQERVKRQKEDRAQRRLEEEGLMMGIRERQQRSLLSIRGVHVPLSQSRLSTSTRGSSTQELPRIQASQNGNDWSIEEKTFLFKKIQESYPNLSNLDDVRWELNRTLEDTEAMAEELLEKMVEAVLPEQSAVDRKAHVREIMQNYRRRRGR
ncbi:hypothetical protein F4774DRAFT_328290 [Daldinia eschscholtzii]|nr:hypothetical protein F4774DRAFT_328290 [Daldinia eschscholtzii]